MFNLLPREQKKKIRKLYLRRFAIVCIVTTSMLLGMFCILLVPSFAVSSQKLKSSVDRKTIIENYIAAADKDGLQAQLAEIKSDIDALQSTDVSAVKLVEEIIVNKGVGVTLHAFSFRTEATGEKRLQIEGVAETRDRLRQFQTNMEGLKFKSVDLPISNFAKDKDIAFDAIMIIANE